MRAMRVRIAREIAFGVDQRRARLVGFVQDRIGADEAKPAFEILAVLRQACGEPIDHGANGAHARGLGQRLDLGRQADLLRTFGPPPLAERRYSFPQHRRPRRILRRFGDELAPNVPARGLVARLLGGKAEKKAGLGGRGILRDGGFEGLFRFRRHHPIGGTNQGFSVKSVALGVSAQAGATQRRAAWTASSARPIRKIHRRQDLIAAPIIRMLRKMRLDLGDRSRHIHARGRSFEPGRERRIGQFRMADRRYKAKAKAPEQKSRQRARQAKPGRAIAAGSAFDRGSCARHQAAGRFGLAPLAHLPAPPGSALRPFRSRRVAPCRARRRCRRAGPRAGAFASGHRTLMTAAAVRTAKINHNMEP